MEARSQRSARLGVGGMIVALTLATAGCGDSDSSETGDGAAEFTYWSMWKEGEAQQEVMAQAIDDFTAETGIEVNVEWQGRDNVQRLVPALNTPDVPDLVDQSYLKTYTALVATQQASSLATAWESEVDGVPLRDVLPSEYLDNIDLNLESGEPWMVPYIVTSDAIWFNASEHPELVEEPPATWTDFIATLEELRQSDLAPVSADGDIPGYNSYWFVTALLRNLGPGALQELANDHTGAAWDDSAVMDAAKKVEELVSGGYIVDGYVASKFPTQQQKWANNESTLLLMGSWAPTETKPYAAAGFEYASFPFPQTTQEHNSARVDFTGFVVPETADGKDAAQQFATFYLREEYQQKLATEAGLLPVRADVEVTAEQEGIKEHLDAATGYHQQNDGVVLPGYNDKVLWPLTDALFLGEISAEEFVSQAKEGTVQYWDEQG